MAHRTSRSPRGSRIGKLAVAFGVVFASWAHAEIKGMPGLDASKPLGQTAAPQDALSDEVGQPPAFTEAQVDRGRRAYMQSCADCHGDQLNNGEFGGAPLTGSYFDEHWSGLTVDALYGFLSSAMPPNRPGSLNAKTYTDITTFLLSKNGYQPTGSEMPANLDAMATMTLER